MEINITGNIKWTSSRRNSENIIGTLWESPSKKAIHDHYRQNKSTSINTQMDTLIPASKISNLTQGVFVGAVSDNFEERIDQKIFYAEIVVNKKKVAKETAAYQPIPVITSFTDKNGKNHLQEEIEFNYRRIKDKVAMIVGEKLERIRVED
jgi:hypothetical protein